MRSKQGVLTSPQTPLSCPSTLGAAVLPCSLLPTPTQSPLRALANTEELLHVPRDLGSLEHIAFGEGEEQGATT